MADLHEHPLALLQRLEAEGRERAGGLPQEAPPAVTWVGLAVMAGSQRLLFSIDQVRQVVPVFEITPVPGTHRWLRGVANVRGELLAVVHLAEFVFGEASAESTRRRLLALHPAQLRCALQVDEVLGLRHFLADARSDDAVDVPASLRPMLAGAYVKEGVQWPVLDVAAMTASDVFRRAAA